MSQTTITEVLDTLRALRPELRAQFGVANMAIFGSRARGQAHAGSDLDLIVGFEASSRPTLFRLAALDDYLGSRLGLHVETTPSTAINPRLEPYIRSELIPV
ncbi:MAG: nucleotidyltransferase family protein [Alphaproteobacteria bacterium]|nr:nucleotidyltransferase family protein [Alphaproteobacteria bacterium]